MMKSSPTINISKVQEKMREEKENINHFEDQELHAPQKRHPMPLPLDLYNQLENSEPNKPKLFTLKGKHVECQGTICETVMQNLNTTSNARNIEAEEINSKTLKEKVEEWIAGIRFNVYHLVFHLIRELEKSLYRREQEKKNQISE